MNLSPEEQNIPKGQEVLRFRYKDQSGILPVVHSTYELKQQVASRIMPGLERALSQARDGDEAGIVFAPYFYAADDFSVTHPEAARELANRLRNAGWPIPEDALENPKQLDPIRSYRYNLVSRLRNELSDHYIPLDTFYNGTFVIGPLITPKNNFATSHDEEVDSSQLYTSATVAIHGEAVLKDYNIPEDRDRIYYKEIVEYLTQAFHPHELR